MAIGPLHVLEVISTLATGENWSWFCRRPPLLFGASPTAALEKRRAHPHDDWRRGAAPPLHDPDLCPAQMVSEG